MKIETSIISELQLSPFCCPPVLKNKSNNEAKTRQFFETLFNPGEKTNFGVTYKETTVHNIDAVAVTNPEFERFCINPLHPDKDLRPTESYHHPDRPRRADCNVTVCRNILIECDSMAIGEQLDYVTDSGLPYSTCCHSGGKSLHFIVSLQEPAKDVSDYRDLIKRILSVLPKMDRQNLNPSRTSRFPFHLRKGGTEQTLIEMHDRISRQALESWLSDRGAPKIAVESMRHENLFGKARFPGSCSPTLSILSPWTKQFLLFGAPQGERNKRLFMAACDCFEKGFDFDETTDILSPVLGRLGPDFLDAEFHATIRSAEGRVDRPE